jgi:hypothetical protein
MPVEQIYAAELPFGDEEPARTVLKIRWGRGQGNVEIGVKCVRADDGSDYFPMLEPIELEPISDGNEIVGTTFIELEAPARANGMFGQFDRDALNEMIRVLRRARNAAFGQDE